MKIFAFLAVVSVSVWAVPSKQLIKTIEELRGNNGRIVHGSPAVSGQFPWQVAIRFSTPDVNNSFCGGALISNQWILTAAHCTLSAISFRIYLGGTEYESTSEGVTFETTEYIRNANYNSHMNNDIALVKLRNAVAFTDKIKAVKLPKRGEYVGAYESVTVSGWGKTNESNHGASKFLSFVELTTVANEDCSMDYSWGSVVPSTLCAAGHPSGICSGDSGGPLVQYKNGEATLVAVVSFAHPAGCDSGKPSGHVRIVPFLDWIASNTGLDV